MSSYDEVVQKDLKLMWSILDYVGKIPRFHERMSMIISKYPWKDISIVIWLFFVVGLFEIGTRHFFLVAMNLASAYLLRTLLEVKRPVEYDIRLQPITDRSAESFGFPSLESYMSIVILGHLSIHFQSILFIILALFVTFVVGFSRVYSRSRFPHQIVGSWLLGLVGLSGGMHCCEKMNFHNMTHHEHGVCLGIVIFGIVANFGLSMESNDSRLLHIPKSEFVRVLSEIISGGSKQSNDRLLERTRGDDVEGDEIDLKDSGRRDFEPSPRNKRGNIERVYEASRNAAGLGESPRTAATKQAQQSIPNELTKRKKAYVKSDSLYFLQKGIEEREAKWKVEMQRQAEWRAGSSFPNDDDDDYTGYRAT